MDQKDVAEKLGTTPQMVWAWENAKRTPGAESLFKLSRVLRVSAHYLITGEDYAPGEADLMLDQIEAILAVRRAGGSGSPIGRDESLNVLEGEQEARANHADEDVG